MTFFKKMQDLATRWEYLLLFLIAYTLFDVPLEAAFQHPPTTFEIVMDIFISAIFFWDARKNGVHHTISRFPFLPNITTALSSIPLMSMVTLAIDSDIAWPIYLQIFRVARLPSIIVAMMERSKRHLVPKRFKLIAAAVITLLTLNILACGWLVIYPPGDDPLTDYNKAMYWLVTTIATVGYGDITPTNNLGRIYTMGVMILGAAIWGILIASASRLMLASDRRKEQKKEKLEALHSFLSHYEIPKNLQGDVIGFFNHLWSKRISEDERAILNDLPPSLQSEIQTYMNLKPISRVSLFNGVSFECLSAASKRLEQVFVSPGEKIITKGEIGHEMYLIGHGSVTIHIGDQFITNLGEGACFGEMALIDDGVRSTDVTAASYCDIFKLSKEKFLELVGSHSDLCENITRIASERKNRRSDDKRYTPPTKKTG